MISLTLPWPPSVNHYWRHARGRHYISSEGQAYRATVAAIVARQQLQPLQERVRIDIVANPPDRRRRDLDNVLKALLDALVHGGVMADDEQIDDLRIVRASPCAPGEVSVSLHPMSLFTAAGVCHSPRDATTRTTDR